MRLRHLIAATLLLIISCGPASGQGAGSTPKAAPTPWPPPLEMCVGSGDQAREVVFRSAKGEQVVGAVLGDGDVGVVLAHQVQSDLCEWLPYAKRLRDQGRRALISILD